MYTTRPHDQERGPRLCHVAIWQSMAERKRPRKLRINPMYGIVLEYSTPPQIASDSDQSSSDPSGML